jgi:hydrogenase maturation protease
VNEWEFRLLEDGPAIDRIPQAGGELAVGTRVRLHPRPGRSDALDLVLSGKTGVIESIEQDYEGALHLAVVLDDDPGRDLGFLRQPGHRFFYTPEEVERCEHAGAGQQVTSRLRDIDLECADRPILIAGIGNIFLGDDAFGVEVARRLARVAMPEGVRVVDFGIRSLDLAYALMDAPGATILIDACARGEPPGTLSIIEPSLDEDGAEALPVAVDAHAMSPWHVLRMVRSLGATPKPVLVLGCEPETLGPEEGQLGMSACVTGVVDEAVEMTWMLVRRIRAGEWPKRGPQGSR